MREQEIPSGQWCSGCPFYAFDIGEGENCHIFDVPIEEDRDEKCLSAYPDGAVVTIVAKEATNG